MLEQITGCVATYLRTTGLRADHARSDVDPARFACLVDSKGSVEALILLVFDRAGDAPVLIAKGTPLDRALRRDGVPVVRIEYDTLERLGALGMNADGMVVPEALGAWETDGLLVTLQSALPGRPMKNTPGPDLFGPGRIDGTVAQVMAWWRRLHACVGVEPLALDDAAYDARVLAVVERFERRFVVSTEERAFLERRFRTERRLAGMTLPMMLRHGDFCPANMIARPEGVAVFDWEFPWRHELPLFDLFHFFGSLRYPFRGPRGESSHFASFTHVFWGTHPVHAALRACLDEACTAFAIPRAALGDLFVLALLEIANLKFDGLVEFFGVDEAALDGDAAIAAAWREHAGPRKDVPFTLIEDGACANTRFVAEHGPPAFD